MSGDKFLWLLLGSFVGWEVYAHFVRKNRGSHTLSWKIRKLEDMHPAARWATRLTLLALYLHLVEEKF